MAKFEITKKVTLEFLGEDYKDSYLTLKAVPLKEYKKLFERLDEAKDNDLKSLDFVQAFIMERFVDGKCQANGALTDVTKEDLLDFPGEVFTESMAQLNGKLSPN